MKLYIDCEWNGYKGALLSIALVPSDPDGPVFYAAFERLGQWVFDEWVLENVYLPYLEKEQKRSREEIQLGLKVYLSHFSYIHIIADWPEDIERFCELLITGPGTRINTPPLTMEVVRVDAPSSNPHHALYDAKGLRDFLELR